MPGRQKPIPASLPRRVARRRARNKVLYLEVIQAAADIGVELGPEIKSIPEVVMAVFRRTHALWLHAATMTDRLDADAPPGTPDSLWTLRFDENGNRVVELSKWVEYERLLRQDLFEQAMQMSHLKLDERLVQVEEATVALLQTAFKNAVERANVPPELQRQLGQYLREELTTIDGHATEVTPAAA